eukprot:g3217.t1
MSTPFVGSSQPSASHRIIELAEREASQPASELSNLDYLARHFGRSLLNVSPRHLERLKAALDNDDLETIAELVQSGETVGNVSSNEQESIAIDYSQKSLFKMAIEEHNTEWIEYFLNMIIKKNIQFHNGAKMINENFKNLWVDYRTFIEPMLKKDVLGWDVCTIKVPLETFTVESNVGARVGTCNSIVNWVQSSSQGAADEHWRKLNEKGVDKILKTSRGRMVNASVRIYCFADICRTGINGIIRFLLMSKAPSSIFKYPLVRWIIVYKWEKIWKVRAFKSFAFFLVVLIAVSVFLLIISLVGQGVGFLSARFTTFIFATIVLILTLVVLNLRREYYQAKRYIEDGRKMFPSSYCKGMRHYFSSRQNQIDLMFSFSILFLLILSIFAQQRSTFIDKKVVPSILAFIMLLLWAKALYHLQAFKRTGLFVLMIGRVVRECLPYFFMLLGFMVGFGFTMYIALADVLYTMEFESITDWCWNDHGFQSSRHHYSNYSDFQFSEAVDVDFYACFNGSQCYHCYDQRYYNTAMASIFKDYHKCASEKEDNDRVLESFRTPFLSVLTMAYAMVGLFDPEVLFKCRASKYIAIAIFVLYLALQTIVMFNMLIATMGDAFDGVRAAEEESFLMACAGFMDKYEAALVDYSISVIERKIGKYLYVLIPKDTELEKSVPFWRGRMTSIKEDVRKTVLDSHEDITQKMDQQTETMDQLTQNMNQLTQNINDMFATLKNDVQSLRGEIKSLEEKIRTL